MSIMNNIRQFTHRVKFVMRNPSCKFHGRFLIERSTIGQYNVFFDNVFISCSSIGDFTFIQKNTNVINADIGKFCSIAAGVRIGLGSHPINYVSTHPSFYSVTQPLAETFAKKDIFSSFRHTSIGHDVWIGENALIKDGITIGTGAIIGAGAVVTKDIPEYAIAVGVPAQVKKYRFEAEIRKSLLDSKWWDKSEQWLRQHCALFLTPIDLIERLKNGNRK